MAQLCGSLGSASVPVAGQGHGGGAALAAMGNRRCYGTTAMCCRKQLPAAAALAIPLIAVSNATSWYLCCACTCMHSPAQASHCLSIAPPWCPPGPRPLTSPLCPLCPRQELDHPEFGHYFVKRALATALDKHDREREMTSVLLSTLYNEVRGGGGGGSGGSGGGSACRCACACVSVHSVCLPVCACPHGARCACVRVCTRMGCSLLVAVCLHVFASLMLAAARNRPWPHCHPRMHTVRACMAPHSSPGH